MQVTRINKKLLAKAARASQDFGLVEPNDRILVAMSGGKDSYALMVLLEQMRRKAPFDFELIGVNLDQGHPGFEQHRIVEWLEQNGHAHHMLHRDTYTVVKEKTPEGKAYCSMCSRLRRGILYDAAQELGCTKIALGHHKDDVVETVLLNLFYSGQLKAMPPRLVSDDKRNIVIRPLVYCEESDIQTFSDEQDFPILPCVLCGGQEGLQRVAIKRLLATLNQRNPKVKGNVFAALANVKPSHLYDRTLWEQAGIEIPVAEPDDVL